MVAVMPYLLMLLLIVCCSSYHRRTPLIKRSGGLTSGEVARIVRQNLNQIRHCYEQLIQRQPGVRGKVEVGFIIVADGRVGDAKIISSNMDNSNFKNCILSRISNLKFPKPRGGAKVDVKYPFVFNPV